MIFAVKFNFYKNTGLYNIDFWINVYWFKGCDSNLELTKTTSSKSPPYFKCGH